MEITGTLEIGNGEPCPWCGKVMEEGTITEDDGSKREFHSHAYQSHTEEFMKQLFTKGYPTGWEGDENGSK